MIKRTILNDLKKHLVEPEMTILIGPRQVGKTYLMLTLEEDLKKQKEKTIFLSLDSDQDKQFFVSQATLINYLRLQVGNTKAFVFIDEIQRKENAGLFLKGIFDMGLPYKFILSGSSSLDLKAKIKESMAGRKRLFTIDPISFEEFVNYMTQNKYEDRLQDFFAVETGKTQSLLEEYMMFGGYPKVILAETADKKRVAIEEIYTSYIERDITDLLRVEKSGAFTDLVKILASQIGSPVNITELSSTIGITHKTVKHYLWYLQETFLLKEVTPFFRNVRSELTKAPMYYFYDIGIRNYLLGLFGLPSIPTALSGHLFENLIFNILRSHIYSAPVTIHFWRTRDGAEVDFVLKVGIEIVPIEVKYAKLHHTQTTRSFKTFLDKYKPKRAYVVNLGEKLEDTFNTTKISFLPYYEGQEIIKKFNR